MDDRNPHQTSYYCHPRLIFGYQFIKNIRLVLIKEKIDMNKSKKYHFDKGEKARLKKKIEKIGNSNLKKNLTNLINVFNRKK